MPKSLLRLWHIRSLVDVENIQDTSQKFEPIHRIVTDVDVTEILAELSRVQGINPSVSCADSPPNVGHK